MSDNPGPASPPRISAEGIAEYRRLLSDPTFERDHPSQHAALAASVGQALAATGQSLSPPSDGRSAPQALHDQRFGISFAPDGRVALPKALTTTIERDDAGEAPNPEAVAAQLDAIGLDYKKTIAEVQALLDRAGSPVKATSLSAHALAQLSVYAAHLARHSAARPK